MRLKTGSSCHIVCSHLKHETLAKVTDRRYLEICSKLVGNLASRAITKCSLCYLDNGCASVGCEASSQEDFVACMMVGRLLEDDAGMFVSTPCLASSAMIFGLRTPPAPCKVKLQLFAPNEVLSNNLSRRETFWRLGTEQTAGWTRHI